MKSKDAGDLLRLLRNVPAASIGASLRDLEATHPAVQPVVSAAVTWLDSQLTSRSPLIDLALADRSGIEAPAQVTAAVRQLTRRMLDAYHDVDNR